MVQMYLKTGIFFERKKYNYRIVYQGSFYKMMIIKYRD